MNGDLSHCDNTSQVFVVPLPEKYSDVQPLEEIVTAENPVTLLVATANVFVPASRSTRTHSTLLVDRPGSRSVVGPLNTNVRRFACVRSRTMFVAYAIGVGTNPVQPSTFCAMFDAVAESIPTGIVTFATPAATLPVLPFTTMLLRPPAPERCGRAQW